MPSPWLLAGAGAFGWLWGSFLNTLVDRTPRWNGSDPPLGWFSPPRSLCLACGSPVDSRDNIPIVSYLRLRGRCRACGAPIGARTLVVEVATPVLAVALAAGLAPRAHWGWALWGAGVLSTAIVAMPTLLERRQVGRVTGAALILAALAGMGLWLL